MIEVKSKKQIRLQKSYLENSLITTLDVVYFVYLFVCLRQPLPNPDVVAEMYQLAVEVIIYLFIFSFFVAIM